MRSWQGERMREIELEQCGEQDGVDGDGLTVLIPSAERSASDPLAGERRQGLVVALAPGLFEVATADGASYLCTLRGRLRRSLPTSRIPTGSISPRASKGVRNGAPLAAPVDETPAPIRVAAGDRVVISTLPGGEGVIEEVAPRRTALARARSEAGTEQVLLA